ncbi:hypothetical protein [Microbacterium murale]|uniref:Uncharacterized protein n=1 Tax=Microbacterium murale TaxID=1081040 RepID=A0ABQ1RNT1_9MICO|nr:hypothetical protein [Microbacterium murale]GGD76124.1 hypothetical protein GCM10007269_18970 [Microbacterium murale]
MDVLEQVRDIRTDDTPVSEQQLNTARQAMLRQIAREERTPSRGRRRWAGASVLAGGVAAAAIAISVLTPARIDPAAAAVLEDAADVTINAVDTQLAPGQYLRIQTDSATLWKWDADMGDSINARFNNANRADAEAGLIVTDSRVLYVPADRSADWIWDWRANESVVDSFGKRSAEAIADWTTYTGQADGGYWPDIQRLPGGEALAADGDDHEYLLDSYRRSYEDMPRDPKLLLEWFRDDSGDPDVSDQWVIAAMTGVLTANLMPADLRAATLRAMALIPGIQVENVDGNLTTLIYRSGDWFSSRTTEVTIDTAQGLIISVAETSSEGNSDLLPDTIPDGKTTVTTTIVDSAPDSED